jgi:2-polyprenyl-6-hydroxyphenyl methylase/3-demethylubiquinone-9 3-methyltransferase
MSLTSTDTGELANYHYKDARPNPSHVYLWPVLDAVVASRPFPIRRAFDIGCGNGTTSDRLRQQRFAVTGVDVANQGIEIARRTFPQVQFHVDNVYEDLSARYGRFPLVVCFEVIEHLYDPRKLIQTIRGLLEPGGTLVLSTPYHGFWKNLTLALLGKWDGHHQPLHHGGHIKFFSIETLSHLLREEGSRSRRCIASAARFRPLPKAWWP